MMQQPTLEGRKPDPERQIMAYRQSAATLNLLRAFAQGGYANLEHVHKWTLGFLKDSPAWSSAISDLPTASPRRWASCAPAASIADTAPQLRSTDFFTSHEALLLGYRAGDDPRRFNHRRLVCNLGPHAVDRRPHPPARSCPCRILPRHQKPDWPEMRPDAEAG